MNATLSDKVEMQSKLFRRHSFPFRDTYKNCVASLLEIVRMSEVLNYSL